VSLSVPAGTTAVGGSGVTTTLVATVNGTNIAGVMFGLASGPNVKPPEDMPPEVTQPSSPGRYEKTWSLDPSWTPAGSYSIYARVRTTTGQTFLSPTVAVQVTQDSTAGRTAAPTVAFAASPTTITSGQSATLTWSATGATSCTASGGWSGTRGLSGSELVSPGATASYALTCTGAGGTTTRSITIFVSTGVAGSIPLLAVWESNMLTYGAKAAEYLALHKDDSDVNPPLLAVYYDAAQVFDQIARYTGDSRWYAAMADAVYIYRDRWVLALTTPGGVSGYWNFTTGLRMDYERTGNAVSKNAVALVSQFAAYAQDGVPLSSTQPLSLSREVAYAIRSYIDAELVGAPRRARRADLVTQAYGHIQQFVDKTQWGTMQVSPFMMGLTSYVLIKDWEQTHDARLIPALQQLADFLWSEAWVASAEGMKYGLNPNATTDSSPIPAPDLNNLIAPLYGFLWAQTGDTKYRDEGDALFAGAAKYAYLDGNKQFDQNYQFSFDYVAWRSAR
jgi:hypothetical protein